MINLGSWFRLTFLQGVVLSTRKGGFLTVYYTCPWVSNLCYQYATLKCIPKTLLIWRVTNHTHVHEFQLRHPVKSIYFLHILGIEYDLSMHLLVSHDTTHDLHVLKYISGKKYTPHLLEVFAPSFHEHS